MQSRPKFTIKVKRPENGLTDTALPQQPVDDNIQNPIDIISSDEEEDHSAGDDSNHSSDNARKQMVIYEPAVNSTPGSEDVPDPINRQPLRSSLPFQSSRVLPSVGAFTVQCAKCFQWRLIPTKEKYEEIREHILEQPFFCETAREWRPEISCEDPPDISQDGSRLWAIDKPNIAQPPPGWERLLRIRGEGGSKFADVYYASPTGKRLRSMVEVSKYLQDHPEYVEAGVTLSQFSFQIPRPLQENYVRKRPAPPPRLTGPSLLEPTEANPLAWAGPPTENTELTLSTPLLEAPPPPPPCEPTSRPSKKQRVKGAPSRGYSPVYDQNAAANVEEPLQSRYSAY